MVLFVFGRQRCCSLFGDRIVGCVDVDPTSCFACGKRSPRSELGRSFANCTMLHAYTRRSARCRNWSSSVYIDLPRDLLVGGYGSFFIDAFERDTVSLVLEHFHVMTTRCAP